MHSSHHSYGVHHTLSTSYEEVESCPPTQTFTTNEGEEDHHHHHLGSANGINNNPISHGHDSKCLPNPPSNESNFQLAHSGSHHLQQQQQQHHNHYNHHHQNHQNQHHRAPDSISVPSSPNTLTSLGSVESSASYCAAPSSISLAPSTGALSLPGFSNSHHHAPVQQTSYATLAGISNCRNRTLPITDSSMFYAPGPTRSYVVVPNTGAIAPPIHSPTSRDSYNSGHILSPVLNKPLEPRIPGEMSKTFVNSRPLFHSPASTMSSYPPTYSTAASNSYGTDYRPEAVEDTLPFSEQENLLQLIAGNGDPVRPDIICKIEKGFFYSSEGSWTCYRRNYFSVSCSYTLDPQVDGYLYARDRKSHDRHEDKIVQALAIRLSASTDGTNSRIIDLVQHTPKRDKGPQLKVAHTKLCPVSKSHHTMSNNSNGYGGVYSYNTGLSSITPTLPLQSLTTQSAEIAAAIKAGITFPSPLSPSHTFERIQFKSATANNGKRRAQQQYYHLIVELYADLRSDSSAPEDWVKVAQKVSNQVVVRGRSPSHYQNEGPNSTVRMNPSMAGLGSGSRSAWAAPYHHANGSSVFVGHPNGPSRVLPGPSNYMYTPMSESSSTGVHHHLPAHGSMLGNGLIPTLEPPRTMPPTLANGRSLFPSQTGAGAADEDHHHSQNQNHHHNHNHHHGGSGSGSGSSSNYHYYPEALYQAGLGSPNVNMVKHEEMGHSGKSRSSPESPSHTFPQHMPIAHKYSGYDSSKGYYPAH